MSYGIVRYDLHRDKLCIELGGGLDEKSIIKALRAASYKRRTLVRTDPFAWFPFLVRELVKLSRNVRIGCDLRATEPGLQVRIYATRTHLALSVIPFRADGLLLEPQYDGSFYAYLGKAEPVRLGEGQAHPGQRMRRKARIDFFRESYKAQHGYYPHEEKPDSQKRYTHLQRKLLAEHKAKQEHKAVRSDGQKRRQERRKKMLRFDISEFKKV